MKPRLLDLFCGAGGAARGYQLAGFHVTGVDIADQPNYCGDEFYRGDALACPLEQLEGFDVIHASPPCQTHVKGLAAVNRDLGRVSRYEDRIAATRERLRLLDVPYVIENVEGSPLLNPVRLCGSSFQLPIRRHRLFESNMALMVPPCNHSWQHEPRYWTSWRPNGKKRLAKVVQVYGNAGDSTYWAEAMGIDWMTRDELREAIPPVYTEHLGWQLLEQLRREAAWATATK